MKDGITNLPDKESDYISTSTQMSPYGERFHQDY